MTNNKKKATLFMYKGLPASGKSTDAVRRVRAARPAGAVVRITKDQIRTMLHDGLHKGRTEGQVVAARNTLVRTFLTSGVDVLVDDTNLNPAHEQALRQMAVEFNANFEVLDFTDVPVDVCVARDAQRPNRVGGDVIRDMYRKWLAAPEVPVHDPSLPDAIICDLDGTLAKMNGRGPFEWDRVGEDDPNPSVVTTVRALAAAGHKVLYTSARDGVCREETANWIDTHVGVPGELLMRDAGDNRKDAVVKREIYENHIKGAFNVALVLDDRDQVVDLWRTELGLPCFQVDYGNF